MSVTRRESAEYLAAIKKSFVETKLFPLLKDCMPDCERVEYDLVANNDLVLKETVTVYFHGGSTRYIDVTADSLSAIAKVKYA